MDGLMMLVGTDTKKTGSTIETNNKVPPITALHIRGVVNKLPQDARAIEARC
jgi:hypothetical protein